MLKNLSSLIISLLFGSGLKEVSVAGGGAGTGVQLLKVGHALSLINFHADKLFSLSFTHTRDTHTHTHTCLLYTSPSPRDATLSRMPSSA